MNLNYNPWKIKFSSSSSLSLTHTHTHFLFKSLFFLTFFSFFFFLSLFFQLFWVQAFRTGIRHGAEMSSVSCPPKDSMQDDILQDLLFYWFVCGCFQSEGCKMTSH